MTISCWYRHILIPVALGTLAACSGNLNTLLLDRRPDYRQSATPQVLEIPPDLIKSTTSNIAVSEPDLVGTHSSSDGKLQPHNERVSNTVLPQKQGVTLNHTGTHYWLLVKAPPNFLWPRIREFWTSNGFSLKREEPNIGVMETDWVESRIDAPQGSIRAFLKKHLNMMYSSPVRDRFRIRLGRTADSDSTEIYLTHSGIEEVVVGGNLASASDTFIWQQRPSDSELETEMLNRLMLYLGDSEKHAGPQIAITSAAVMGKLARLIEQDGESQLIINEGYSNAWQLVGMALDRNDYSIKDQDRTHGLYIVEYRDLEKKNKKHRRDDSWLANLFFWSREIEDQPGVQQRYWVRLSDQNDHTIVVVRNSGDNPDISAGARQVLETLQRTLK